MTDIIQELRGLIAEVVPESDSGWYISNTTGSGLSIIEDGLMFPGSGICPIKCEAPQAALIVAAINHIPALLDRLEAAEPWRKHYFDMAKAAGDLKAAVRPQLDAMPFADHAEVRKAFNDIAIVAGRALDHMQPKDAPAIREVKP